MIPVPSGVRVWLAVGHTDMRRGMNTLAVQVQQGLGRDPHAGDLYVFRGKRGHLIKILWHDGIGMSLYAKRLERGRFIWPSAIPRDGADRTVAITPAQLGYLLEGIDWRLPQQPGGRKRRVSCFVIAVTVDKGDRWQASAPGAGSPRRLWRTPMTTMEKPSRDPPARRRRTRYRLRRLHRGYGRASRGRCRQCDWKASGSSGNGKGYDSVDRQVNELATAWRPDA